jgi:nitroreductase
VDFADVVRLRRMVRAYDGRPIGPRVVERIVDTARRAPSAGNTQATVFLVVDDADGIRAVAGACGEEAAVARGLPRWLSSAPVLIVPCVRPAAYHERYAEPDKRASRPPAEWDVPWWWVDAGQALALLLCAAVDEGLAAGLLAADSGALRRVLGIPADVEPLGVVTIGHPAPDRRSSSLSRGRRPLGQVLHRGAWGRQEAMDRFPFAFDPRYRPFLLLEGVTDAAEVRLADGELDARFGWWRVRTPLSNVSGTRITGPYRWWRVIGTHVSLADRGLSFGTNTDRGLCITFTDPVPGMEPTGRVRHPGLTVTVAEPERLAEAIARS